MNDGNSLLYDSMINKINPRTLGNHGNRQNISNTDNDSITKHAKQIGMSGPVISNTQSRIEHNIYGHERGNINMVHTPDYQEMGPPPTELQNRNLNLRKNVTEISGQNNQQQFMVAPNQSRMNYEGEEGKQESDSGDTEDDGEESGSSSETSEKNDAIGSNISLQAQPQEMTLRPDAHYDIPKGYTNYPHQRKEKKRKKHKR